MRSKQLITITELLLIIIPDLRVDQEKYIINKLIMAILLLLVQKNY